MPTAADDKYSRGVLGVRTGSEAVPRRGGARRRGRVATGAGMVRYLGPTVADPLVLQRRPETVTADGRVQAWLIGSGTDAAQPLGRRDRGAARHPVAVRFPWSSMPARSISRPPRPRRCIVTPHGREHARLRDALGLG